MLLTQTYLVEFQRWAAIGVDETIREQTTPNGASAYFFPPINVPPPVIHSVGSTQRWGSCFPPPSLLPWWCVTSEQQSGK